VCVYREIVQKFKGEKLTQNQDDKSVYDAIKKVMIDMQEKNYELFLENRNLKLRLAVYEPELNPKEQEFMEAIREVMHG